MWDEILKGLEFEPTVDLFYKRHANEIQSRIREYMKHNPLTYGEVSGAHVHSAVHKYISGKWDYYSIDNISLIIEASVVMMFRHRAWLRPMDATAKDFAKAHKDVLHTVYYEFRERHGLGSNRRLGQLFMLGIEEYMRVMGMKVLEPTRKLPQMVDKRR
jgi:hypothetical protein